MKLNDARFDVECEQLFDSKIREYEELFDSKIRVCMIGVMVFFVGVGFGYWWAWEALTR